MTHCIASARAPPPCFHAPRERRQPHRKRRIHDAFAVRLRRVDDIFSWRISAGFSIDARSRAAQD